MIELNDYWMGRNITYALSLTPQIEAEAQRTVDLANRLLATAALFGIVPDFHPVNHSPVSSGWRPPAVNAATANAAPNSKHMTGKAIDLYDPDGDLDNWLMTDQGIGTLESLGLWIEHPSCTKGWCHLQTVPPKSNRRVFYP